MKVISDFYTGLEEEYDKRIDESRVNSGEYKRITKNIGNL